MSTPTVECVNCKGKGSIREVVQWSDGLGMSDKVCELCDGSGHTIDLASLALQWKRTAQANEQFLGDIKPAAAIYLALEDGVLPNPPLAAAYAPTSDLAYWKTRLAASIGTLPRVQPGDCSRHHVGGGHDCAENVRKYPTSPIAALCSVTLAASQPVEGVGTAHVTSAQRRYEETGRI